MVDDSYYRNKIMMSEPLENPCPRMTKLGYTYNYRTGLIDETPYYTRVEEDMIIYAGESYTIQFNLGSHGVVFIMHDDNAEYYGGKPTFFASQELLECVEEVMEKLGWRE